MEFTGGGWKRVEDSDTGKRYKVIDAHSHIFPRLGSQTTGLDPKLRVRFWQYHLRDWLTFWRKRDGQRIEQRLLDFPSNRIADMPDVNFHFTDFGRAEFTLEGEVYSVQFYTPTLANMEAPPQRMLAEMTLAGIDASILQADHLYGDLNEWVGRAMREHPGRFIGLAQVWEPAADRKEQIERLEAAILKHGNKGLYFGVEPLNAMGSAARLDDPQFTTLWNTVRDLKIPVFWYIDDRAADRAGQFLRRVEELDRWSQKYPEVISVVTHGLVPAAVLHEIGYPDQLLALMKRPNMHAEIMFPAKFPEYPYPEGQKQLKQLRDELGAEKLLWGSDSPYGLSAWCTYTQSLDFIRAHCDFLSADEKGLILGGNAQRIFDV
jgi:predicted TIM-barrel fold metal-dependent hydrolase